MSAGVPAYEVDVFVCEMDHPRDLSRLEALFDEQLSPDRVVAVVGKTHGDGLHDDYGRELAELSLLRLLAERTGDCVEDIAARMPIILSGGAIGVITAHLTIIARSLTLAGCAEAIDAAPRLTVGTAMSQEILPEEIGRLTHIHKVAAAVRAAAADAGLVEGRDVHCVLVKGPTLTPRGITAAHARGRDVVTEQLAPGVHGAGEYANDASSLGVAVALEGIAPSSDLERSLRHDFDIHSRLAHASCGGEKRRAEVCLLGNARGGRGQLLVGHAMARDLVDAGGVKDALRSAGLAFDCCPSDEQLDRVVQVFAHPVVPADGVLFGRQTALWGDTDAPKATKALVGGILAGTLRRTSIYVSGGEHNSHQGPPGGYPVAAIVSADSRECGR